MFTANHWVVTVSVRNPLTDLAILVAQHECRDRLHAQTLLAEIRDLADQLGDFLPGVEASCMEYCTEEPAANPLLAHVGGWLQK